MTRASISCLPQNQHSTCFSCILKEKTAYVARLRPCLSIHIALHAHAHAHDITTSVLLTQGALSSIYAATHPELSGKGGRYIGPSYTFNAFCCYPRKPLNPRAADVDAWRRLWDETYAVIEDVTGQQVPRTLPPVGTRV